VEIMPNIALLYFYFFFIIVGLTAAAGIGILIQNWKERRKNAK
jgi:hypothetical protein